MIEEINISKSLAEINKDLNYLEEEILHYVNILLFWGKAKVISPIKN